MRRSVTRAFGKHSRATMAQQAQQQQQEHQYQQQQQQRPMGLPSSSSSPMSQRSTSVLASLMRMRSQFQRLRSGQQQRIIATVLARSNRTRLLGATPEPTVAAADGEDDVGDGDATGSNSKDASSPSLLQTGILLCAEAQRLLRKDVRPNDSLSDVPPGSPLYAMEAGKLLSTAVLFGASTAYPRVQEVCAWIRAHPEALHTPRQIMSICMPLVSLADGPTAGAAFVLEVLYEPLLLALQDIDYGEAGPAAPSAESPPGSVAATSEQQLVALTSAFAMVARWTTFHTSQDNGQESSRRKATNGTEKATAAKKDNNAAARLATEQEKMLTIVESSVAALTRLTRSADETGSEFHDAAYAALQHLSVSGVVQWLQALHGLEATQELLASSREDAADGPAPATRAAEDGLSRLSVCYEVLTPCVQRVLEMSSSEASAGVSAMNSGSASSNADRFVRVQDVADLVQLGLFASVEPLHAALALQYGLQALPRAMSHATVKELCLVSQMVNRVRQQRPTALSAATVNAFLAAARPRLFLLRETQAYQLRPQDCSLLLSQLSRWEEVSGVAISADIVELLSSRLGEQMPAVGATQLVTFVQALARLEERHREPVKPRSSLHTEAVAPPLPSASSAAAGMPADSDEATVSASSAGVVSARRRRRALAVRYHYPSTPRLLSQCVQRVGVLAAERSLSNESAASSSSPIEAASPPALSASDAASLLQALVQLRAPQVALFFSTVEPLLRNAAQQPSSGLCATPLHTRVTVQDAVSRFIDYSTELEAADTRGKPKDPGVQRAVTLLASMEHSLVHAVQQAERPKDLVMLSPLIRHRLALNMRRTPRNAEDGDDIAETQLAKTKRQQREGAVAWRRADVQLTVCFAQRITAVAPACNGLELGLLAGSIGSLVNEEVLPRAAAQKAIDALWERCTAGLGAAEASPCAISPPHSRAVALTLEDCRRLMDGARITLWVTSVPVRTACPVVFLSVFADLCADAEALVAAGEAAASAATSPGAAARGTRRSYDKALADVQRYTTLGRSLLTYLSAVPLSTQVNGGAETAAQAAEAWREAWHTAVESYLGVLRAAVAAFASEAALCESWFSEATSADGQAEYVRTTPLKLLSMTANVAARLQQLLHRPCSAAAHAPALAPFDSSQAADVSAVGDANTRESRPDATAAVLVEDGEGETGAECVDGAEAADDVVESTNTIRATVRTILMQIGDAIAVLEAQQQDARALEEASGEVEDATRSRGGAAPTERTATSPKHVLMLLQAFEIAQCRHPEMLYSILPELRRCAEQLDPLTLSLLLRAMTQLGAWSGRLLQVLAAAVETKVDTCELRQCYTLLRGLCRSGRVSADTFVELRGTTYTEWSFPGTRRGGDTSTEEPLQHLAERVLWRLDALVRTETAFAALVQTAALADLMGVIAALRFFRVPPPPTYDAFVVLAIRRLILDHGAMPAAPVVQHSIVLLDAVASLRQPFQRRVSARAVWTVLHRRLSSTRKASAAAVNAALPLQACWELWRYACLHSLQYGSAATGVFFEASSPHTSAGLAFFAQQRLAALVSAYAEGPAPSEESTAAAGRSGAAASRDTPLSTLSSASDLAALRRYGLHASPSLVRGDRDLSEHLCFPLRLARQILEGTDSLSSAERSSSAVMVSSPVALAKKRVRHMACLLRADLWSSSGGGNSCSHNADEANEGDGQLSMALRNEQLVSSALQHLWSAADAHHLLHASPETFSIEELLVLAATAARLQSHKTDSVGSTTLTDDCAAALHQLCTEKTEWSLASAVDAWVLLASSGAVSSAPTQLQCPALAECSDAYAVLARSGDVLLSCFLRARQAWATRGGRVLPELLRLVQVSDELSWCVSGSLGSSVETSTLPVHEEKRDGAAQFEHDCAELRACVLSCVTGSSC